MSELSRRVNETSISIEFLVVLADVDLNTLEHFLVSQGCYVMESDIQRLLLKNVTKHLGRDCN